MSSLNFVPTAFQKENKIPNLVLSDLNNLFMALDDACARELDNPLPACSWVLL